MKKGIIATLLAGLVLAGCASTTSGGLVGVNRAQFTMVPEAAVNQSAAEGYAQLITASKQERKLDQSAQAKRVNRIFNRLLPHTTKFRSDALKYDWEINVIKSDDVNAFAMPGGKMVVYTGIIDQLKLTDDELAAIIGHEMAHVLREHSREKVSQEMAKSTGITLIATIVGLDQGAEDLIQQAGQVAFSLPFSRKMETEADLIGLELMANAGYNPEAAVTLWKKMAQLSGSSNVDFLSTHPASTKRISSLEAQLSKFR